MLTALPLSAAAAQSTNPLEGMRFYVDQESPAWLQWQAYQRSGQTGKANLIWKIAREPRALWLGTSRAPTSPSRSGG